MDSDRLVAGSAGTLRRWSHRAWIVLVGGAVLGSPAPSPVAPSAPNVVGRNNQFASVAARGAFAVMVWAAADSAGMDVFASVSRNAGVSWSGPVRVNSTAYDARVSGEQPPRVVLGREVGGAPEVTVVWTTRRPDGSRLLWSRSGDGGRTFRAATVVPDGGGGGNRGWHSVAADRTGRVLVLWLDHRNAAAPGAMHHQGEAPAAPPKAEDPVTKAGRSQLYVASLDGSLAPHAVTAGVCYCCKTSLTVAADGSLRAAWRHVFSGNQRDIATSASRDGGRTFTTPVRVSEDRWEFDGCPENGPVVATDATGRVHVAWPSPASGGDGTLALYYATSQDGQRFTPRTRVPTGSGVAHVQMATLPDGDVVLAWDEIERDGRAVRAARVVTAAAGRPVIQSMPLDDAEGRYPVVAIAGPSAIVTWVRPGRSGLLELRTIVMRLPGRQS